MTPLEKEAAKLIPERVGGSGPGGFGGGGGGRGGFGGAQNPELAAAMRKIPQHMTGEVNALVGKKKTILEIRNFIAGEFEPIPIADVMDYFKVLEKTGMMKLNLKPEEPKAPEPQKPAKTKPKK